MSPSETKAEEDCAACAEERIPLPETTPHLPVVQLGSELKLSVFYSEREAIDASCESPEDEFYDTRGILLTRVEEDGEPGLEACGEGRPAEVQGRVMEVIRAALHAAELAPEEVAEAERLVDWLQEAPSLESLLDGTGQAPVMYTRAAFCVKCSFIQRLKKHNNCCPAKFL